MNLDEAFVDATLASAKKGARYRPDRSGKGTRIVALPCGDGLLLAVTVGSASPAEYRLVESVLEGRFLDELPARLIGDKAYNSDRFDEALATEYDIELITPNRLRHDKTQDGWPLCRYRQH